MTGPALAPLDPTSDEARSSLRRELLRPEYHEQDLIGRLLRAVERFVLAGIEAASNAPPLSTLAALLVFALLALGLVWLASRARRTSRAVRPSGAVLTEEAVTARELRARAEAALADGRPEGAVVDGFRALAVRQVEHGWLDDLPGATAHEVAAALAEAHPGDRDPLHSGADLFDRVLYGDRPATREQAAAVLGLDDRLAARR